jgi:23S rRNA pseudouridine1911/1915/1917 synthase
MLSVLYEDKDVVILNKPAGITVHPSAPNPFEETLVSEILKRWPEIKNVGEDPLRPGIVHRLDKETSGILVVAKNQRAFEYLKKQFQERKVAKTYLTLVVGKMPRPKGEIQFAIGRSKKFGKFAVRNIPRSDLPKSRAATTHWKVMEEYRGPNGEILTLLEIKPETGRTHQIRVHLAAIGHPVVGDKLYGRKAAKKYRELLGRQFLHASSIEFVLPAGGRIKIEADLPQELEDFLSKLNS